MRILIVEDEMTIAMMLEDMIAELGHEVAGVASRLDRAVALASTAAFDLAILDVNLDGRPSMDVAAALTERDIPFFFATGYGRGGVDARFAAARVIGKPFVIEDIAHAIAATARG